jgi:hypothetical protein
MVQAAYAREPVMVEGRRMLAENNLAAKNELHGWNSFRKVSA